MQLRNCILIALAFDATQAEIDNAHDLIDRTFGNSGGVDPSILVSATVNGATGGIETSGTGQPIAPTTTPGNIELDAAGLPWDERIHSSNHQRTEKGVWRAKRNVDPSLKSKVEAELRATLGATPAAAASTPPPAAPAPIAPPSLPGANLPPMPGAAAPDPAYAALVQFIAQNTHSATNPNGRLTDDWVKQVLTHYGVADGNLQNLAHNPALVPTIDAYIRQALQG